MQHSFTCQTEVQKNLRVINSVIERFQVSMIKN